MSLLQQSAQSLTRAAKTHINVHIHLNHPLLDIQTVTLPSDLTTSLTATHNLPTVNSPRCSGDILQWKQHISNNTFSLFCQSLTHHKTLTLRSVSGPSINLPPLAVQSVLIPPRSPPHHCHPHSSPTHGHRVQGWVNRTVWHTVKINLLSFYLQRYEAWCQRGTPGAHGDPIQ